MVDMLFCTCNLCFFFRPIQIVMNAAPNNLHRGTEQLCLAPGGMTRRKGARYNGINKGKNLQWNLNVFDVILTF